MLIHTISLAVATALIASTAVRAPQTAALAEHGVSRSVPRSTALARKTADDPPVFQVDDGSYESIFGIGTQDPPTGKQAVYLNRFTPGPALLPFTLDTISILLP